MKKRISIQELVRKHGLAYDIEFTPFNFAIIIYRLSYIRGYPTGDIVKMYQIQENSRNEAIKYICEFLSQQEVFFANEIKYQGFEVYDELEGAGYLITHDERGKLVVNGAEIIF